ncbi:hypothetical protein GCM10011609_84710 [Lentzea pudingi]|uniref:Uncharacterized protein n=1 Tax=Lentzea pudingi TaxID=1789439 RepID=A0ABQ2IUI4_9PSEU|nr:hypothetical protein GCM10011609_84710 [Lentzea pudingi]
MRGVDFSHGWASIVDTSKDVVPAAHNPTPPHQHPDQLNVTQNGASRQSNAPPARRDIAVSI